MPFYVRFVVKDRAGIVGDIGQAFGRIGVNISEIWQLRHVEEEMRELEAELSAQAKTRRDFAFRYDFGARDLAPNAQGSGFDSQSRLYPGRSGLVSDLAVRAQAIGKCRKLKAAFTVKYIILQGDGMADYPIDVLGGKTPLEAARTPNMDWLAQHGVYGIAHVIPKVFRPAAMSAT